MIRQSLVAQLTFKELVITYFACYYAIFCAIYYAILLVLFISILNNLLSLSFQFSLSFLYFCLALFSTSV